MGGFVGSPKPGSPRAAIEAQAQRIRARTVQANIPLTTDVPLDIPFVTETYKNGITHSTVADEDEFTIEVAGRYLITAQAYLSIDAADAAVAIALAITVNGATFLLVNNITQVFSAGNDFVTMAVTDIPDLDVGDVIRIRVLYSGPGTVLIEDVGATVSMHRLS